MAVWRLALPSNVIMKGGAVNVEIHKIHHKIHHCFDSIIASFDSTMFHIRKITAPRSKG